MEIKHWDSGEQEKKIGGSQDQKGVSLKVINECSQSQEEQRLQSGEKASSIGRKGQACKKMK